MLRNFEPSSTKPQGPQQVQLLENAPHDSSQNGVENGPVGQLVFLPCELPMVGFSAEDLSNCRSWNTSGCDTLTRRKKRGFDLKGSALSRVIRAERRGDTWQREAPLELSLTISVPRRATCLPKQLSCFLDWLIGRTPWFVFVQHDR